MTMSDHPPEITGSGKKKSLCGRGLESWAKQIRNVQRQCDESEFVPTPAVKRPLCLRQQIFNHICMLHPRELLIEPLVLERELLVIHSEHVQDRRVEIVNVNRVLDDVV